MTPTQKGNYTQQPTHSGVNLLENLMAHAMRRLLSLAINYEIHVSVWKNITLTTQRLQELLYDLHFTNMFQLRKTKYIKTLFSESSVKSYILSQSVTLLVVKHLVKRKFAV